MAQVYALFCTVNKMAYIGCCGGGQKRLKARYREHRSLLNRSKHSSKTMIEDWQKYGEDNFFISMLEETADTLEAREACELKWMLRFKEQGKLYNPNTATNRVDASKVSNTGRIHTAEERAKRAASNRKPKCEGHGAKISATKKRLGQRPTLEAARLGGLVTLAKHGPLGLRSTKKADD